MTNPISICTIPEETQEGLVKFKFRKDDYSSALILKIDREKQEVLVEACLDDINVDSLQDELVSHQPRYIVLTYRRDHGDGRISYPLCLIFYSPRDSHAELQMMYAGTKTSLQNHLRVTRSYDVRELDDLTEEWLLEKLGEY